MAARRTTGWCRVGRGFVHTCAQGETMRKSLMVFACVVATMLVFAVPAYATFSSHVLTGIPGGIAPLDSPSIQGGVCGDPNQYPVLNCPTTQDQLFVTRFRVYTNGNAAAQNVNAIAYL